MLSTTPTLSFITLTNHLGPRKSSEATPRRINIELTSGGDVTIMYVRPSVVGCLIGCAQAFNSYGQRQATYGVIKRDPTQGAGWVMDLAHWQPTGLRSGGGSSYYSLSRPTFCEYLNSWLDPMHLDVLCYQWLVDSKTKRRRYEAI